MEKKEMRGEKKITPTVPICHFLNFKSQTSFYREFSMHLLNILNLSIITTYRTSDIISKL